MQAPPFLLDGTRVIQYAVLEAPMRPQRTSLVVEGVSTDTDTVRAMALAENLVDGSFFLLHCNERWETVAAGHYADIASAERAAAFSYAGLPIAWRARALSAEEEREVATTRAFLRDIASGDGDG